MFGEGGYKPPEGDGDEESKGRDNTIEGSDHLPQTKEDWDKEMGIKSGAQLRQEVDELLKPMK